MYIIIIDGARSTQQLTKFYFAKGGLIDDLPNFLPAKVSLRTVHSCTRKIVLVWLPANVVYKYQGGNGLDAIPYYYYC